MYHSAAEPTAYITELEHFVQAGYTRAEALLAATKVNAELLELRSRLFYLLSLDDLVQAKVAVDFTFPSLCFIEDNLLQVPNNCLAHLLCLVNPLLEQSTSLSVSIWKSISKPKSFSIGWYNFGCINIVQSNCKNNIIQSNPDINLLDFFHKKVNWRSGIVE